MKATIIISVEGVMTSDPLCRFWQLIANTKNMDAQQLEEKFNDEIQSELFSGRIPEQDFWIWLEDNCQLDLEQWKEVFLERRYPLLAAHIVNRLSDRFNIVLLCGQRKEWFEPLILSEDLSYGAKEVIYCSTLGIDKKDSKLYQTIKGHLWLDNDGQALTQAEAHGFTPFYADQELYWLDKIETWRENHNRSAWKKLLNRS